LAITVEGRGNDRDPEAVLDEIQQRVHIVHFEIDPVGEPGLGECLGRERARSPVGLKADEDLARGVSEFDPLVLRERMAGVAEEDQFLGAHRVQLHPVGGRLTQGDDGQVDPARAANEQGRPELGLQGSDGRRQPGLGDLQRTLA
jgi:hypothetical protein